MKKIFFVFVCGLFSLGLLGQVPKVNQNVYGVRVKNAINRAIDTVNATYIDVSAVVDTNDAQTVILNTHETRLDDFDDRVDSLQAVKMLDSSPVMYYVSPNGSDSNNGTSVETAWATVSKVNAEISGMNAGDIVAFQCGGIWRGTTLRVTRDSVTITSYGAGDKPVFSGLQVLSNPTDEGGGVYSYSVSEHVYQVFQNKQWLYPSRWPNDRDTVEMWIGDITSTSLTDTVDLASINPGARLYGKVYDWTIDGTNITGYTNTAQKDTIKFENFGGTYNANFGIYITGIVSEIDEGEWGYNSTENKLYVWPVNNSTDQSIEVTKLDTVINVLASNITIEGIKVLGAQKYGIHLLESGLTDSDIVIKNVDFERSNMYDIFHTDGNLSNLVIHNCDFKYTGAYSIRLYGVDATYIHNNSFYGIGTTERGGDVYSAYGLEGGPSALYLTDTDGLWIYENVFEKIAYIGAFLYGSEHQGRIVRDNYFHEIMLSLSDGGAIKFNATASGDSLTWDSVYNNEIINCYGSLKMMTPSRRTELENRGRAYAIYIDECVTSGSITQRKRVFNNSVDSVDVGVLMHYASAIQLIGNTIKNSYCGIINSGDSVSTDSIVLKHNRIENYDHWAINWVNWSAANNNFPVVSDYNVVVKTKYLWEKPRYIFVRNTGGTTPYSLYQWRVAHSGLDQNSMSFDYYADFENEMTSTGLKASIYKMARDLSSEVNTSNASSDPGGTEANATTGWTSSNLDAGANVFESQSGEVSTGTYALHANANDTPTANARFYKDISASGFEEGDILYFSFDIRHVGTGGDWRVVLENNPYGDAYDAKRIIVVDSDDTDWITVEYECVIQEYGGNILTHIVFQEEGDTNDGGVYVDNISIKKLY